MSAPPYSQAEAHHYLLADVIREYLVGIEGASDPTRRQTLW